jgi:hypothetical protein
VRVLPDGVVTEGCRRSHDETHESHAQREEQDDEKRMHARLSDWF